MERYYIAYGSNLNLRQMSFRCPTARLVGTGMLRGYRLLFRGSRTGSYLTIEKNDSHQVPVAVWKVTELDERALDRYEGYPSFYRKEDMELDVRGIRTGHLRHRKAFVYIMDERRQPGIPTVDYLRTCLDGYRSFRFDPGYLEKAYKESLKEAGK